MTGVKPFNTSNFFAGGSGIFIQYHDIIKPVYLQAIIKMMMSKQYYGLPVEQLSNLSPLSIVEWYIQRRYQNPLLSLDYRHSLDPTRCDNFLIEEILNKDPTLYTSAPMLNIQQMMYVYKQQHMCCPVYVYTKQYEPHIINPLPGISTKYLYGDLSLALKQCDQNFTYILSDIELVKELAILLKGTCSHILISQEYRYNKQDNQYKYSLRDLQEKNQFVRIGTHNSVSPINLAQNIQNLITGGIANASS